MNFIKEQNEFGYTIIINDNNNDLVFILTLNGDLYITLSGDNNFIIKKENDKLYKLIEQLFLDIEDINIFDDEPYTFESDEERINYLRKNNIDNNLRKDRFKRQNRFNYNELYDEENETITWYSDDIKNKNVNLKIKKIKDLFEISFQSGSIIKINKTKSRYNMFNILFFKFFNNLNNEMNIKKKL